MSFPLALLTTREMAEADRLAVTLGLPSLTLMDNAGAAVASTAADMVAPGSAIAVLCGPGNNGGDGFVAARHLKGRGFRVRVALLGELTHLKGDAAEMARRWHGAVEPLRPALEDDPALVIDALFGAGLSRPLDGVAAAVVSAINTTGRRVLAVDVPSGLDADTGEPFEVAVQAERTVTFFRRKPGHLLLPGRLLCGQVSVADIGIPDRVLETIRPRTFANAPELWADRFPRPRLSEHKYNRGQVVVLSGPPYMTGAARLAARGALRIGAGLVTVASPPDALTINAAHLTAIMLRPIDSREAWVELLTQRPGSGDARPRRGSVEAGH